MKYSVLMSIYKNDNSEHLNMALESIYDKQTMKPDEIVIVFDGPITNELQSVLSNFRKGKEDIVFYYPQEINKGLGEALRIGAEKCTGDYIFRMDSDDISDCHRFEKQINYINEHPEIDVLGTNILEFQNSPEENNMRMRICPSNHDSIVQMSKKRCPMNHVSVCVKKRSLINNNSYLSLLYLEDYYLWLRMIANNCKFANLQEPLVYVRVGNGRESRRTSKKMIKGWKTLQDFMLDKKMITKFQARRNMFYIWGFVNCPIFLKKFLYNKILRKKQS